MKGQAKADRSRAAGGKKLWVLWGLLVVFIALAGATLIHTAIQQSDYQNYVRVLSEQQILSQRIAAASVGAVSGQTVDFSRLQSDRSRFSALMQELNKSDLPKDVSQPMHSGLTALDGQWRLASQQITQLVGARQAVGNVVKYVRQVNHLMPRFFSLSDEVTNRLIVTGAPTNQVYLAQQQSFIVQRIRNSINQFLYSTNTSTANLFNRFSANVNLYGTVLQGLLSGNTVLTASEAKSSGLPHAYDALLKGKHQMTVPRVSDPKARAALRQLAMVFSALSDRAKAIATQAPQMAAARQAVNSLQKNSNGVLMAATNLEQAVVAGNRGLRPYFFAGYAFGGLALVTLVVLGLVLYSDKKRELALTNEQNRRNQRAILRLLDEMTNLAEGDLTVHATVTEDITGAIADSVNYAIDALRSLVTTINQTAVQVATASEKTQTTALRLTDASNHQAREIASASAAVTDMADSIEQVAGNAMNSADVAKKSVEIAAKGSATVHRSIDGMNTIREQIQDTSKRIKRLGESSQEIGDIVGLINDIADQTNILALNAAIQASAAGEAGRGFAVVADEVQRLAERSANATRQIEALVKTIQADTNEAVLSMEQSTANVVAGGQLAEDAGEALAEIEGVSNQLAKQIMSIASAARQQAAVAANVTNTMNVIQEITMQTSDGTNETAQSIGQLAALAAELRRSVAGFKLPDSEDVATFVLEDDEAAA